MATMWMTATDRFFYWFIRQR